VGGLGCVGAKLNVVQSIGFVRLVAPLLILLCVGFCITYNVSGIAEGGDF